MLVIRITHENGEEYMFTTSRHTVTDEEILFLQSYIAATEYELPGLSKEEDFGDFLYVDLFKLDDSCDIDRIKEIYKMQII